MLRRSVSRQDSRHVRSFPTGLKKSINENALSLVDEIPYNPFANISNIEEDVNLKEIDSDRNRSKFVELSNLLDEKQGSGSFSKACDHVCIVGSKGSGKTTVLTKFIKQSLQGNIPQIDPDEHIVHLIRCHDFDPKKRISVSEFLFRGINDDIENDDLRTGFEWICENPTMLTFVIDSLDTIPYAVKPGHSIGPRDHATPSSILFNLLDGQLFLGCGVVSTCDEKTLHSDDEHALPTEKFVAVCGFSPVTISKIALSFLGKETYYRSFVHFKNTSPYLLTLCEHPSVLILTLISLKDKEDLPFTPKGLSGVILLLLVQFMEDYHQNLENMISITNKLKYVSYLATCKGRTILKTSDLKAVGCTEYDLKRFSCSNTKLEMFRNANEEDVECFHPVFLHALSALYIAEMDVEKFEGELPQIFYNSNYKFAIRYIPGFLLNDQMFEVTLKFFEPRSPQFIELKNNRDRKCKLLKKLARSEIIDMEEKFELIEQFDVLHMICESAGELKDIAFNHFDKFSMSPFGCASLSSADLGALATCISWRVKFKCLDMNDCHISAPLIETLHKCMLSTNNCAKINVLSINYQGSKRTASEEDAVALSHFFVHVLEQCDLRGWYFNQELERCLQDKLNSLKSFRMTANINRDDVLVAQNTWSDVTEENVSPDGGFLELNDCSLDFPEGSLEGTRKVKMEMRNVAPVNPEDYIIMSPCINVICKSDILKPVLVGVKPWCFNDGGELEALSAEILHLEDEDDIWATIKTITLDEENTVQFECDTFSSILVAIKKVFVRQLYFPITGLLYAKGNTFCIVLCLYHRSTIKETEETLRASGFTKVFPLPFNEIGAKFEDMIEVTLGVNNSEDFFFDIKEENKPAVTINGKFVKRLRCHHFTFCLRKKSRGKGTFSVIIYFKVLWNGKRDSYGEFEHEITLAGPGCPKRIEDVFQDELLPRFANYIEYKKFAMSSDGFKMSMQKLNEIDENKSNMFDKQMEIFNQWRMTQGDRATPGFLRNRVQGYFTRVPYALSDERVHLEDAFDEAINDIGAYHAWIDFAVSDYGLQLSMECVYDIIGGQENITRTQKKEMLEMWRDNAGDSASRRLFQQVRDEYNRFST